MPSFLAPFLILISTFVLGGKPVDIPPFISQQLSERGNQVSELVKNLPTLTPTPVQSEEPDAIDNSHSKNIDNQSPDTNKVPAYNNRSDKEMPTNLPQNAIDNSGALNPMLSPTGTSEDPVPPIHPDPEIVEQAEEFVGSLGRYDEPDILPQGEVVHGGGIGQASESQTIPGHKN